MTASAECRRCPRGISEGAFGRVADPTLEGPHPASIRVAEAVPKRPPRARRPLPSRGARSGISSRRTGRRRKGRTKKASAFRPNLPSAKSLFLLFFMTHPRTKWLGYAAFHASTRAGAGALLGGTFMAWGEGGALSMSPLHRTPNHRAANLISGHAAPAKTTPHHSIRTPENGASLRQHARTCGGRNLDTKPPHVSITAGNC